MSEGLGHVDLHALDVLAVPRRRRTARWRSAARAGSASPPCRGSGRSGRPATRRSTAVHQVVELAEARPARCRTASRRPPGRPWRGRAARAPWWSPRRPPAAWPGSGPAAASSPRSVSASAMTSSRLPGSSVLKPPPANAAVGGELASTGSVRVRPELGEHVVDVAAEVLVRDVAAAVADQQPMPGAAGPRWPACRRPAAPSAWPGRRSRRRGRERSGWSGASR